MAFQSVPNTASIEFRAEMVGISVENTMYVTAGAGYTQAEIDDIAEIADDAWATYMLPNLGDVYVYRETYVKGLANVLDLEATIADHAGDLGGQTSPTLPANNSFAIKFQTGFTGRSARGRNYVTALTEGDVTTNFLSTTRANAIRDAYISIATALNAGGYPHVVVSRYTGGAKRTTGLTLPVTVIAYSDLRVDSQRGRLS